MIHRNIARITTCLAAGVLLSLPAQADVRVDLPGGRSVDINFDHLFDNLNPYPHPNPIPEDIKCAWGSGFQGCIQQKVLEEPVVLFTPNLENPGQCQTLLEEILDRGWTFCDSFYGCGAGAEIFRW